MLTERPVHHFGPLESAPDAHISSAIETSQYAIPEYKEGNLLEGRAVLLTGTGRHNGIGAAIAREFGSQRARLIMTATESSREEGEDLAAELQNNGTEAYWVSANLSTPGEADRLVAETVDRFGRLDIVGANQGIRRDGPFKDLDDSAYQDVFDINFMATVRLFRASYRQMAEQSPRGGVLLATTSIANEGSPGQGPYSSMKGAERSLVNTIAREGTRYKIRANAIAPGLVEGTNLIADLTEKAQGRVLALADQPEPILPEDVAHAYLYFATEKTGNLTGQEMQVLYRGQVKGE